MAPQRDAASRIAQPPPSTKRRSEVTRRLTDGLSPGDRSLLLDLAYEEFCQREEAGEQINVGEFCRAYPGLQHSLARMIEVHVALRSTSIGNEPAVEPKWPQAGDTWLGWKLVEPLGRGAFSRVFLATEPELGDRKVVVKCTLGGAEEAYILGKLNHPHIVPILSVKPDKESGLTGICMPYLGRRTLADGLNELLAERAAPSLRWFGGKSAKRVNQPKIVTPLIEKIARGLAAAHAEGILHGDIKPSNILTSFDHEPLLADFNLSRNLSADAGRLGGTPPYMAPEVLRALLRGAFGPQQEILTAAADQYSLGIVAYELLTGDLPYEVQLDSLGKLPFEKWPTRMGLPPFTKAGIERRLYDILTRATAFDPSKRFASVREFSDQLKAVLQTRANRRRAGFVAASVLGGIVAMGGVSWGISQLMPEREFIPDRSSPFAVLEEAQRCIDAGEYLYAGQLLSRLQVTTPSDISEEWAAYCFAREGDVQHAKNIYLKVKKRGVETAAIDNNLGYCHARNKEPVEAEAAFATALKKDDSLQAAYHNRGVLRFNNAASNSDKCPTQEAWDDLQTAIRMGPPSGSLYAHCATFLAFARLKKCPQFGELESYAREALAHGTKIDVFQSDLFSGLNLEVLAREAAELNRPHRPDAALLLPPARPLSDEASRLKSLTAR